MLPPDALSLFPADYFDARRRFTTAAQQLASCQFTHPLKARGPRDEELTIDVARIGRADAPRLVLISSGLHGVEGFFGSAVQLMMMESIRRGTVTINDDTALLLVHALNPYGFSHLRRANDHNVDLNRNFLLPGEAFAGSPSGYRGLHPILNPARAPQPTDRVTLPLTALVVLGWHGIQNIKQTIASGQHDFPQGLFFGGLQHSETVKIVAENLCDWIGHPEEALHLDFHTGLGRWTTYKLLFTTDGSSPPAADLNWVRDEFGAEVLEEFATQRTAYDIRGGWGPWCAHQFPDDCTYIYLCAEFGTYSPFRVLAGLRAENQAHFRGSPSQIQATRKRLVELFCPQSCHWRTTTLSRAHDLLVRSLSPTRVANRQPVH